MSILILAKLAAPLVGVLGTLIGFAFVSMPMAVDDAPPQVHKFDLEEKQDAEAAPNGIEGQGFKIEVDGEQLDLKVESQQDGTLKLIPVEPEPAKE